MQYMTELQNEVKWKDLPIVSKLWVCIAQRKAYLFSNTFQGS